MADFYASTIRLFSSDFHSGTLVLRCFRLLTASRGHEQVPRKIAAHAPPITRNPYMI